MTQHEQALAIRDAIVSTEIKFHDDAPELIARFRATGREITFDDAGKPVTSYDSLVDVPLSLALTKWAADNAADLCDRRTLPREAKDGRPGALSRADFPDAAAKSRFIADNGLDAWEAMPSKPQQSQEVRHLEDFWALDTKTKSAMIASDPTITSRLKRRPVDTFAAVQQKIAAGKARHRRDLDAQQAEALAATES